MVINTRHKQPSAKAIGNFRDNFINTPKRFGNQRRARKSWIVARAFSAASKRRFSIRICRTPRPQQLCRADSVPLADADNCGLSFVCNALQAPSPPGALIHGTKTEKFCPRWKAARPVLASRTQIAIAPAAYPVLLWIGERS